MGARPPAHGTGPMVKLLAIDLDGTLIRRDGEVDERDREAIARVYERGVPVTIVTGRLYAGTRALAERLGIRFPVACADGAQLVDPSSHRELHHVGVVGAAAQALRQALASRQVVAFLLYRDAILHDPRGAPFGRYVRSWSPDLVEVADLYDHPCWGSDRGVSGCVAIGADADIAAAAAELRGSGRLRVIDFAVSRAPSGQRLPATRALLAHDLAASKGTAIDWLARHGGCRPDEVAAVGDWLNDVDMFAACGRSFAMAHAPEHVRSAATDRLRADSKTGGGVAEAVALLWPAG